MKQASTFTRVSAAAVTILLLALGFLVSSGLLVPLLVILVLALLARRHAQRRPGPREEDHPKRSR